MLFGLGRFSWTQKYGFTLAEVLITLGVIGIVAAMTLPALIQKQQKKILLTQIKATYSILYEALNRAKADYGEFKYWSYNDENLTGAENSWNWSNKYLVPYIKNVKLYNKSTLDGCNNITYRMPGGSVASCSAVIGFCDTCNSAHGNMMTQIHLPNGAILLVLIKRTYDTSGEYLPLAEFHFDVNGYKGPNVWGKDIFRTQLYKTCKKGEKNDYVLGYNACAGDRNNYLAECTSNNIYRCFDLLQADGWEIRDDYPW